MSSSSMFTNYGNIYNHASTSNTFNTCCSDIISMRNNTFVCNDIFAPLIIL
jgi:hypothetical protein